MRKLQSEIPTLEKLGLPPVFREIVKEQNGIILVTGGTGTGKTTTLAAMLNELNQNQEIHIVTLEDPIEFFHSHSKAAISQRELGKDFPNFADGLRAALRQAPKAILVGEIRDRETLEIAMTASETGHVVFSTLHTINAGQTINRILGMFAREEEQQIRQRLSETLRYVVSQTIGDQDRRRPIARHRNHGEQSANTGNDCLRRIREQIVPGNHRSRVHSWLAHLRSIDPRRLQGGRITDETAMLTATNKGKVRRELDLMQRNAGVIKTRRLRLASS